MFSFQSYISKVLLFKAPQLKQLSKNSVNNSKAMAALTLCAVSLLRDFCSKSKKDNQPKYGLPVPKNPHQTLSINLNSQPIFIVGDIHGCFDEFNELLQLAKQDCKRDDFLIVSVGDMINKGPKSLETMNLVMELRSKGLLVAVRGNHEEAVLREYFHKKKSGNPNYPDRCAYLKDFTQEDFDFLLELPYTITIPSLDAIIVHAGLVPNVPLDEQLFTDMAYMRNLITKTSILGPKTEASSKIDAGVAWAGQWKGPPHIFFGHDARRGLQLLPGATGLDSGCLYGKQLTGVMIGADRKRSYISVPAKEAYVKVEQD